MFYQSHVLVFFLSIVRFFCILVEKTENGGTSVLIYDN